MQVPVFNVHDAIKSKATGNSRKMLCAKFPAAIWAFPKIPEISAGIPGNLWELKNSVSYYDIFSF